MFNLFIDSFVNLAESYPWTTLGVIVFLYVMFNLFLSWRKKNWQAEFTKQLAAEKEEMRLMNILADKKARYEAAQLQRNEENLERARKRKDWLANNKTRLYYNTVCGITSVLRPDDFEDIKILTLKARRDERWLSKDLLIFDKRTFLFATQPGKDLIVKAMVGYPSFPNKVLGWISQLDEIVEENGVELIHDRSIFVPFVNESHLPFKEQETTIYGGTSVMEKRPNSYSMVKLQAPKDLWPLPDIHYCTFV